MTDKYIVGMVNPMLYLSDIDLSGVDPSGANPADAKSSDIGRVNINVCQYRCIRHGEHNRDTSTATSAILIIKPRQSDRQVDYALPWGIPHSGDYDSQELSTRVNGICMATVSR